VFSILIWISDKLSPYGYHESKYDDKKVGRFNYSTSLFTSLLIFVGSSGESGRSWSSRIVLFGYLALH